MSVTARQLSKTGIRGKDLDAVIRDQLNLIDEALLKTERKWGRNVISYRLPTTFPLGGISKADAQRVIYTSIIRSLTGREFKIKFLLEEDLAMLFIEWNVSVSKTELDAMNLVIQKSRILRKDLDKYFSKQPPLPAANTFSEKKTVLPPDEE